MSMFEQILLKAFLDQQNAPKTYGSKTEAGDALKQFLEAERGHINEGDDVERNEIGRRTYGIPGDDQAARCIAKLPPYIDANGQLCDIRIAVALAKDVFRYYDVDSRCFRVVGTNTVNVFDFKKKPR